MNYNDFKIQFVGLKDGIHNFVFKIDNTFFELFNYSELTSGKLTAKVELNKTKTMLTFTTNIKGFVDLNCDYCLEQYQQTIEINNTTYVKFGEEYNELDDNLIVIDKNETYFDIADLIYQLIVVNLPLKRIHPLDSNGNPGCNPGILNKINELLVEENKNERDESINSNWKNELKKLKNGTS